MAQLGQARLVVDDDASLGIAQLHAGRYDAGVGDLAPQVLPAVPPSTLDEVLGTIRGLLSRRPLPAAEVAPDVSTLAAQPPTAVPPARAHLQAPAPTLLQLQAALQATQQRVQELEAWVGPIAQTLEQLVGVLQQRRSAVPWYTRWWARLTAWRQSR